MNNAIDTGINTVTADDLRDAEVAVAALAVLGRDIADVLARTREQLRDLTAAGGTVETTDDIHRMLTADLRAAVTAAERAGEQTQVALDDLRDVVSSFHAWLPSPYHR